MRKQEVIEKTMGKERKKEVIEKTIGRIKEQEVIENTIQNQDKRTNIYRWNQ